MLLGMPREASGEQEDDENQEEDENVDIDHEDEGANGL